MCGNSVGRSEPTPRTLHTHIYPQGDITVLVSGSDCKGVADEAAAIDGVSKVLETAGQLYAVAANSDIAPPGRSSSRTPQTWRTACPRIFLLSSWLLRTLGKPMPIPLG